MIEDTLFFTALGLQGTLRDVGGLSALGSADTTRCCSKEGSPWPAIAASDLAQRPKLESLKAARCSGLDSVAASGG